VGLVNSGLVKYPEKEGEVKCGKTKKVKIPAKKRRW
jgi:hypothetical protein